METKYIMLVVISITGVLVVYSAWLGKEVCHRALPPWSASNAQIPDGELLMLFEVHISNRRAKRKGKR